MPGWMAALETIGGLVDFSRRWRSGRFTPEARAGAGAGTLETRLAAVVVAALKEAFDRDHARMDLERGRIDDERRRAEAALRAELARRAGERAASESRLVAIAALAVLLGSIAVAIWLPGARHAAPKTLLGAGWAALVASLAAALSYARAASSWAVTTATTGSNPAAWSPGRFSRSAPLLLVAGIALMLASVMVSL